MIYDDDTKLLLLSQNHGHRTSLYSIAILFIRMASDTCHLK